MDPLDARDAHWMTVALAQARLAEQAGDVPVGAALVDAAGNALALAHNTRELHGDPTAHAELLALRSAGLAQGRWHLEGATLYVTLEPCVMCAGALVLARVERVVWGTDDPKAGGVHSLYAIGQDPRLNHRFAVRGGVLREECAALLERFFRARRPR